MAVRSSNLKSALIRFDVSVVPAGAVILDAKLQLYVPDGSGVVKFQAYQVLRPWDEGQVTWTVARSGDPWGLPGCDRVGIDRAANPVAEDTVSGSGMWVEFPVTELVAAWVGDARTNHGLLVKMVADASTEYQLASSEHWKTDRRPKLSIVYGAP